MTWTRESGLKGAAASHAVTSARRKVRMEATAMLTAQGMPTKVIARRLGVSPGCVCRYKRELRARSGA